jgi:hypothetical protein
MPAVRHVTYNYSLPKELSAHLAAYCESRGRTPSDVVRQLMLEYLEGDRVPTKHSAPSGGPSVRSSMRLRATTLKTFEREVEVQGRQSKGAVLEALLRAFLSRSPKVVEQSSVTVLLPTETVREAAQVASTRGVTLCDFLSEMIVAGLGTTPAQKEKV